MSLIEFFILVVTTAHAVHGQDCSWTWRQPSGSGSTLTRSVGAVAIFSASVNDVLTDTALLTWKSGPNDLSIEEYTASDSSFSTLVSDNSKGITTSFAGLDAGGHVYNMSYQTTNGVSLSDDSASITVTSQGCTSSGTSPSVNLAVRYCDLNAFSSEGNATDTTDCGYNCVRQFTCIDEPTLSFQATCQIDATWSETTPTSAERCKTCNATYFLPSAFEANSINQAGLNQTKTFNCTCPIGFKSFIADCLSGLVWNYTTSTNPCHAACNASEVTFASPANDSFLCGIQPFTCNSHLVCEQTTFDLECGANGTWISIAENQCLKKTCTNAAIDEICGDNCQYENISGISCGDILEYNCTNGTMNTTSMPILCNSSGAFDYSVPLCNFSDTNAQDTCEGCNSTDIAAICGEYCHFGNLSGIGCNETLLYNCINGAVPVTMQPIECVETNYFNFTGSLCEVASTMPPLLCPGCNSTAIEAICGEYCSFGNVSTVGCNQTLLYNCTDGASPVTTQPIECIGSNDFNFTGSLCEVASTLPPLLCPGCNSTAIEAICGEYCSFGNVSTVGCYETLLYSCTDGASPVTTQPIECIGSNDFNFTGSLCEVASSMPPLLCPGCNSTAIEAICGEYCSFGNASTVDCNQTLLYNCTDGASPVTTQPIECVETNDFNFTGSLCEVASTMLPLLCPGCNSTAIEAICGEYCSFGNVSTVGCNETLSYSCTAGAVAVTNQPIKCVGINDLNFTGSLCEMVSTMAPSLCPEGCNSTAIEAICGEYCSFGNASRVDCNETLLYNCTGDAVSVTSQPIECVGVNEFNFTGSLCFLPSSCLGSCNLTAIQAICGEFCYYGNLFSVGCNETLSYNCTGDTVPATTQTIQCIGINHFNFTGPLCQQDPHVIPPSCTEACNSTAIQEICGESCQYENISGVDCNETLSYYCTGGASPVTTQPITCIGVHEFNFTGKLCKNSSCPEVCNLMSIEAICGQFCQYGNLSSVKCNETLLYQCTDGANRSLSEPITCIGANDFNFTGSLCTLPPTIETSTCSGCNMTGIQAICGDSCQYRNITSLGCNETLSYNCTGSAKAVTSEPVICIDANSFNYPDQLCQVNASQSECSDNSCIKRNVATAFTATTTAELIGEGIYLGYLHKSRNDVFMTWWPWPVYMSLLAAVAVAEWVLIGISETADTIPSNTILAIGVVLITVGTISLAIIVYSHHKASRIYRTSTSKGRKQRVGKVTPETSDGGNVEMKPKAVH